MYFCYYFTPFDPIFFANLESKGKTVCHLLNTILPAVLTALFNFSINGAKQLQIMA